MTLTLNPRMWTNKGPLLSREDPFVFEVMGLPDGDWADIGSLEPDAWAVLHRRAGGPPAEWRGHFATKEEALRALTASLSPSI